jgi:hypothetical protein
MELNQEYLSKEHMLSETEVRELELDGSFPLVEEVHGTYGLQVIRKTYQTFGSWSNDIYLDSQDKSSPTYVMGKSNIPLCVVGVSKNYNDKLIYTFKSAKSFKERGDTHHTESIKLSSLMRNLRKRNAIQSLDTMLPNIKDISLTLNNFTSEDIHKIINEYRDKVIRGAEYHELLKYALNPNKKVANDNEMVKTLKEFDDMQEDIDNRKSDKASMFSKPIYIVGYNQLSEAYYEYVYDIDTTNPDDIQLDSNDIKFKLSALHKPLEVGKDYPINIKELPNYDKYASILPMWSARLPEQIENESDTIIGKYFCDSRYSRDRIYDSKLSVMTWGREQGYGWGKHDFILAIFNIEDV